MQVMSKNIYHKRDEMYSRGISYAEIFSCLNTLLIPHGVYQLAFKVLPLPSATRAAMVARRLVLTN